MEKLRMPLYRVIGTGALLVLFFFLSSTHLASLPSRRRCGRRQKTLGEYVEYFNGVAAAERRRDDDDDDAGPRFATGYTAMRFQEWTRAAERIAARLGVRDGDMLWESGVGAGFFLEALAGNRSSVTLSGADASDGLLRAARLRFQRKRKRFLLYHDDVRNLSSVAPYRFDKAVSFSVFQYLASAADAVAAADAMVRLVKSGGVVYVGNVYDESTKAISEEVLPCTSGHLYLPKAFWHAWAANNTRVERIDIVDERDVWGAGSFGDVAGPSLRYSVFAFIGQ